MKGTTTKVEDEMRRKMAEAAERYAEFLRETPDERARLDEWLSADLARPPRRKHR